jgi:hypothetical protein
MMVRCIIFINLKYNNMFATRKVKQDYLKDHAAYRLYNYLESISQLDQYIGNTKPESLTRIQKDKYRNHQMNTLLRVSFNFAESAEGFRHWEGISNRLSTIEMK